MALPVALQLYSIRDEMAKDMREALIKVMSMGYDGVEFAGLYGHSASEIKALCAELGLNPISAHVPIDDMVKDPEGVVSTYAEIGCKYIVVPYVIEERRPGGSKFDQTIEDMKMIGEISKYVLKYTGRAPVVHLKDFAGSKSENMYELIGIDKKVEHTNTFEFRPVGFGNQNIPDILAASEKAGAGWVVVEQDQPSMGKTPLECAKMSRDYLKLLGW